MTAVSFGPVPKLQFNQNGIPLSGGKLFTYAAGSTTKLATYTDTTGSTPNTNPIILDSNGQCDLFLNSADLYKLVLSPSNDTDPPTNAFWTEDNVAPMCSAITLNNFITLIEGSTGAAQIGYTPAGTGAKTRTVAAKLGDITSVLDFSGVDPTGATDSTAGIMAAINAVDAAGGGILYFPPGTYATSTGLTLGNGSASQVSSKHNRITLMGSGYGSSSGIINQQVNGATRILYTGSASSSTAVIALSGPMYGVCIEDMELDCASLAGIGLTVNHCTQSTFRRVSLRNYTSLGYNLTTQSGFPSGCAFGNADNRFYDCYGFIDNSSLSSNTITGIYLSSGVSTGSSLSGQPDSARNVFIGGTFFYGTTSTSFGVVFNGADNNTLIETEFFPYGGTSSGKDIWFQQWAGGGTFPLENNIINPGMTIGAGGNGGVGSSWGNTIFPYPTSDGASFPPSATGVSGGNHLGQTFVSGVRAYRVRQITQASSTTSVSTATTATSDIPGYSVTISTAASTYLMAEFIGNAAKATSGNGNFFMNIDGSVYGEANSQIGVTLAYGAVACKKLLAVGAGSHTVKMQWSSSDTNAVTLNNGTLTVTEHY